MAKRKLAFKEWQHPRDVRGRFTRGHGSGDWAARAAKAFEAAAADTRPPAKLRGPRISRNAKAAAILEQHVPGAGGNLSKKYTPPPLPKPKVEPKLKLKAELPSDTRRKTIEDIGFGDQVQHDGVWRRVQGTGFGGGTDYVIVRDDAGKQVKIPIDGYALTRPDRPDFHEPLRPAQAKRMAQFRADAAKPPPLRIVTNREENRRAYAQDVQAKDTALKEAQRKARARANRKYPAKEGYSKRTRDNYVDEETWPQQSAAEYARGILDAFDKPGDPGTETYLDKSSYRMPVLDGTLNRDRPLAVYGDLLRIEDNDQGTLKHLADMELLPAEVHLIVARHMQHGRTRYNRPELSKSTGIWLGSKPVSQLDHQQELATERPRGWAEGKTFDHVDGVYNYAGPTLVVGVSESSKRRGEKQPALHELGHALDSAVGSLLQEDDHNLSSRASEEPAWVKLWQDTLDAAPDISPYFRQKVGAGNVELWAEAFGEWARARAKARQSETFTGGDYLSNRGEMAMRSAFQIPKERHDAAAALNAYFEDLVKRLGIEL